MCVEDAANFALLLARVWVGAVMFVHGWRHVKALQSGPGMANWLESLGLRNGPLQAVDVTTWPHPGFPTDLQAPFVSLMTQAQGGPCYVSEAVFENRFQHVPELRRLGADVYVEGRSAIVTGPTPLHGATVTVPDIRSGAALVVAALCAEGTTALDNIYHLDRGYQDIVGKLEGLGAHITRVAGEAETRPDLSRVVGD